MSAHSPAPAGPDTAFLPPSAATRLLNPVVARLTLRSVAAPRRAAPTAILVVLVLGLAGLVSWARGQDPAIAAEHLDSLVLGVAVPLLALIVGTAALGPAIEDGSIIYFLAKPLRRSVVARSAVAACVGLTLVLTASLTAVATLLMAGTSELALRLTLAATVTAAVAVVAYTTLFALLSALTRNGVLYGLVYTLVWESTVGGFVEGAKTLSVRQWALSIGEAILGDRALALGIDAAVGPVVGGTLLVAVVVA
ncbi:MAG: hypothetical protein U0Q15_21215, partial [Kineosporiaceae bacterium]